MQITLEIPDDITQASLLTEADGLREIAIALAVPKERIALGSIYPKSISRFDNKNDNKAQHS